MQAIILEKTGGVENLVKREIEKPSIKENEVLVKVKAICPLRGDLSFIALS